MAGKVRGLGWIFCCMVVVPACCFATSFGASERIRLNQVEGKIRVAEKEILAYETEFAARASQVQLEQWNGTALGLGAPEAGQYVVNEDQLASLGDIPAAHGGTAPQGLAAVVPAEVKLAQGDVEPRDGATAAAGTANTLKQVRGEAVAMLDDKVLAELKQLAAAEAKRLR